MISVQQISAKDTYNIRLEVLRKNIPKPFQFEGDEDTTTFHLGAFENGKLISVSSYMKVNNPKLKGNQYQLRGMATLTKHRGKGAGKNMLVAAFEYCKAKNVNCIWCNARIVSVEFYKKLGFATIGTTFDIEYIGTHYTMYKYL